MRTAKWAEAEWQEEKRRRALERAPGEPDKRCLESNDSSTLSVEQCCCPFYNYCEQPSICQVKLTWTFSNVETGSCQKGTLGAKQVLEVVRLMGVYICEEDNENALVSFSPRSVHPVKEHPLVTKCGSGYEG